jgi:hypothetical protein
VRICIKEFTTKHKFSSPKHPIALIHYIRKITTSSTDLSFSFLLKATTLAKMLPEWFAWIQTQLQSEFGIDVRIFTLEALWVLTNIFTLGEE